MAAVTVYQAYGLCIASELPLPELPLRRPHRAGDRGDAPEVDVHVRVGEVPVSLHGTTRPGDPWQWSAGHYLLTITGVGRFLVTDGRQITIAPAPDAAWEDIRGYLLGAVCGVVLQTCGVLALHGSSVTTPRGAVVFLGRSGSGKSTLLSTLLARGYTMMADDVTAVRITSDQTPLAYPGYPHIRLFDSVLRAMGHQPDTLPRLKAASGKFLLPAPRFASTPAPVAALFELTETPGPDVCVDVIPPADQLVRCSEYVRARRLFRDPAHLGPRFARLATLLRAAPLRRLRRPSHPFRPEALADRVEQLLTTPEVGA